MHTSLTKKPPRRNDAAIPDDILLPLAPIAPPAFAPPAAMPYAFAQRRPPGRVGRALGAVATSARKKAGAVAKAIKPEAATINKEHLLGVGANAAGGIATALLAHEFIDNVGVMPLAIGATVLGGAGSAFMKGNWQRAAQGMLGAGVSQLGTAYLTERALKKAAAARPAPAAPAAPAPRNAAPVRDDAAMVRALERAERRIAAMLDDERAGGGDELDADLFDAPIYAVPV